MLQYHLQHSHLHSLLRLLIAQPVSFPLSMTCFASGACIICILTALSCQAWHKHSAHTAFAHVVQCKCWINLPSSPFNICTRDLSCDLSVLDRNLVTLATKLLLCASVLYQYTHWIQNMATQSCRACWGHPSTCWGACWGLMLHAILLLHLQQPYYTVLSMTNWQCDQGCL